MTKELLDLKLTISQNNVDLYEQNRQIGEHKLNIGSLYVQLKESQDDLKASQAENCENHDELVNLRTYCKASQDGPKEATNGYIDKQTVMDILSQHREDDSQMMLSLTNRIDRKITRDYIAGLLHDKGPILYDVMKSNQWVYHNDRMVISGDELPESNIEPQVEETTYCEGDEPHKLQGEVGPTVNIKSPAIPASAPEWVIAGFDKITRRIMEDALVRENVSVKASVTKDTKCLICHENYKGPKLERAREHNVRVFLGTNTYSTLDEISEMFRSELDFGEVTVNTDGIIIAPGQGKVYSSKIAGCGGQLIVEPQNVKVYNE